MKKNQKRRLIRNLMNRNKSNKARIKISVLSVFTITALLLPLIILEHGAAPHRLRTTASLSGESAIADGDAFPDDDDPIEPIGTITDDEIRLANPENVIEDPDPLIITIEDTETPMAQLNAIESWSLLNLILTIAGIVPVVMIGVKSLVKKKREKEDAKQYGEPYCDVDEKDNRHGRPVLILAILLLAVAGIEIFSLTQDMRFPMVIIDWWTPTHAIQLTCGILSYILAYKKEKAHNPEQIKIKGLVFQTHPLHQQFIQQLTQEQFNPNKQPQ